MFSGISNGMSRNYTRSFLMIIKAIKLIQRFLQLSQCNLLFLDNQSCGDFIEAFAIDGVYFVQLDIMILL